MLPPTSSSAPNRSSGASSNEKAGVETRAKSAVVAAHPEASERLRALQEIAATCASCTACALSATRRLAVPGAGAPTARLVLVGEGPGENEDEQGLPFVGQAGKLLTKMLESIALSRDDVFITNIVKCRPPDNRVPHDDEIAACRGYLERQVEILKPDLIVTLGGPAARFFLEVSEIRITKVRGQFFRWRGVPLLPTLHPAYLLRQSSAKKDAWEDLKKVRDFLGGRLGADETAPTAR